MRSFQFLLSLIVAFVLLLGCNSQTTNEVTSHEFTNDLITETSPYLLQHAHNPVNWKAWNSKTLKEAKESNKLMLISVGYAACHWCHVMEKESFEDSTVAAMMNANFVNIKIDKEERPDVDQVYMNAVQLMTGRGGWPLNVIALPDGRPIWGGTYFPKKEWMSALGQVHNTYQKDPQKLVEYANRLQEGIKQLSLVKPNENEIRFDSERLEKIVNKWSGNFDLEQGGQNQVPKFMMPNNYQFLMRYAHQTKNETLQKHVVTTLDKISYGGVYDHVGGGFSRYSTDAKWHIPHFEKMLYDNAQLVGLYAEAFLNTKSNWYKQVVFETLQFVANELTSPEGAFYSSLDADSLTTSNELEEGVFYVWNKEELQTLLKSDFELFSKYYNVNNYDIWEHNNYVLIRSESDKEFIASNQLNATYFFEKQKEWKQILFNYRSKRSRPRLDDKILTSWNALMLKGYVDAFKAFGEASFMEAAIKNATFIINNQLEDNGKLWHNYKDGKSTINGYLEDYSATIDAFIALYEITLDEDYLKLSKKMVNYVDTHFYDNSSGLYFFTSNLDDSLVARNIESLDQVIPSSNSIMANNLYKLYHYFSDSNYLVKSKKMLHNIQPSIEEYASGYSNWLQLYLNFSDTYYEVVVTGAEAKKKIHKLHQNYYPNKLIAGTTVSSENPLFKGRYKDDDTFIFICQDNACKYPVTTVEEALSLMK